MEFTLFYEGELKSNGDPVHKQQLRRAFHAQLNNLWQLEPLAGCREYLNSAGDICLLENIGGFTFAPLISRKLCLAANVRITLLRPEEPCRIIQQSGDIDNRLKTLFDALSVPSHANQIPAGDAPRADESPFYCLLQDDQLITGVAVTSERLLTGQHASATEVVLLIHVKTKVTRHIYAAIPFL